MLKINKAISSPRVQFNPAFYKRAYKLYKAGNYNLLIEMMRETRTDSHVFGCLKARVAGCQRPYSLTPFSEDTRDVEHTIILKEILHNLNMRKLFKRIQEAILYKYAVIDFEWELINNLWLPVSFTRPEQKYFKYDEDGVLKIDFGETLKAIPPDALICEHDDIPELIPVLRDFILKNFGLESWASFLEVFGEPLLLAKYPPGAIDIKKELDEALEQIAASSRGSMPDNTDLELKETTRTTSDHHRFADACDNGITIAILGHENAVKNTDGLQIGENNSSYWAKRDIIIDDTYFIEEQFKPLLVNIWDRNFGDGHYPTFEIDKSEPFKPERHLEALELYLNTGSPAKPEEFRKLGIDVPEDVEVIRKTNTVPGF